MKAMQYLSLTAARSTRSVARDTTVLHLPVHPVRASSAIYGPICHMCRDVHGPHPHKTIFECLLSGGRYVWSQGLGNVPMIRCLPWLNKRCLCTPPVLAPFSHVDSSCDAAMWYSPAHYGSMWYSPALKASSRLALR